MTRRARRLAILAALGAGCTASPGTDPPPAVMQPTTDVASAAMDRGPPPDRTPTPDRIPAPDASARDEGAPTPRDASFDRPEATVAPPGDSGVDASGADGRTDAPLDGGSTGLRPVRIGPEVALGAAHERAYPQAATSEHDGVLRVVWYQGAGAGLRSALAYVAPAGPAPVVLAVPGTAGAAGGLLGQYAARLAALGDGSTLVTWGELVTRSPTRATWHVMVHHPDRGFREWERFPAQDDTATGAGEEIHASVTGGAATTAWVHYGYLTTEGVMVTQARGYRAGARTDGPVATVDRLFGKGGRFRAAGSETWGVAHFNNFVLQRGPGVRTARAGAELRNGWESVRCTVPATPGGGRRHPSRTSVFFGQRGDVAVAYAEWEEIVYPSFYLPRRFYLATDPFRACRERVPLGPPLGEGRSATPSDGEFGIDGFGLGDGRLFVVFQVTTATSSRLHYLVLTPGAAIPAATPLEGTEGARWVVTADRMPDGGGYVIYRAAAGQLVFRRVVLGT